MISKIKNNFKYLPYIFRSFFFCLKYFPVHIAIRIPILISSNVRLLKTKGIVILPDKNVKFGIIKIGFGHVGIFNSKVSKSIWEVSGKIIFSGRANIGHGSKICVGTEGVLSIGNNFCITAESSIICFNAVTIGNDCLFSWDILIMDTDFHKIIKENEVLNKEKPIKIGNRNWIGCRTTIIKGTETGNGCIIGAQSLLNKNYCNDSSLIAGNPATILKEDIDWII